MSKDMPMTRRFRWGEFTPQLGRCDAGLCLFSDELDRGRFSIQWNILIGNLFLNLPISARAPRGDIMDKWGFSIYSGELQLNWGRHTKVVYLPWFWHHVRHEVFSAYVEHPYSYTCDDGRVQDVTASIRVEEREWRWRWLRHLPWPRKVKRYIDVRFSGQVGERTGGWKGGTVGCGYDIKPGETPVDTLRRMERDRRFD